MKSEKKEIFAGVLLVALLSISLLFVHARAVLDKKGTDFVLYAPFNQSDGLMVGADVRMGGIKVGRVVDQTLNNNYQVLVKMEFFNSMNIPIDSSVIIETDGLLGAKHIEIVPGADEEFFLSGGEFEYTQDALILSDLMDKVNAYMREKNKKKEDVEQENTQSSDVDDGQEE
ncbi:MAG: MCE family protein [Alphaproteobacteria bacterium]|nr:MCE family protein [Alphaproteobacteria bacterium]